MAIFWATAGFVVALINLSLVFKALSVILHDEHRARTYVPPLEKEIREHEIEKLTLV